MNRVFMAIFYRPKAKDYWGFCLSEDSELLFESSAKTENELKSILGLGIEGFEAREKFIEKYPRGYQLVFVPQEDFERDQDFKRARMRSMHNYAHSSI